MRAVDLLETFWFTFPQDPWLPFGIGGVTAYSEADARAMLEERGVSAWFTEAKEILVRRGVRIQDLDQSNVVPNIGPMHLRGVWYPCMNIGFGAPRT
jgi:hypothetical protein